MMKANKHAAFWRTLGELIQEGTPILKALDMAGAKVAGTPLESAAAAIRSGIERGSGFADSMQGYPALFSSPVIMMTQVGEETGALPEIMLEIAAGLEDGSFPLPGEKLNKKRSVIAFWQAMARLLDKGTPLLRALQTLCRDNQELGKDIAAVMEGVEMGSTFATALAEGPSLGGKEIAAAVRYGEAAGQLEVWTRRIAEALRKGKPGPELPKEALSTAALDQAEDDGAGSQPIIRLVNRILATAIQSRASDIHFDVGNEFTVRIRVDGVLQAVDPIPRRLAPAILSRIKIMAGLNIAEKRLPQNGRMLIKVCGREIDLRLSTAPTVRGERIVMRVLDRTQVQLKLENIGFSDSDLVRIRDLCRMQEGCVIVTGPTGSGKTTVLYSMLRDIRDTSRCIITIEDPVEFEIDGIAQMAIRPELGLTFATLARSVLRQAPNVIMIGELRDLETTHIAMQSALTGHMVFTTLHAGSCVGAVKRLVDIGVPPFLINSSVAGIVAPRLVRMLCPECRKETAVAPSAFPPEVEEAVKGTGSSGKLWSAVGCEACNKTGYRGRTAMYEMLIPDDGFRKALAGSSDADGLRRAAKAAGMVPMIENGFSKALSGITSLAEVMKVIPRGPNA